MIKHHSIICVSRSDMTAIIPKWYTPHVLILFIIQVDLAFFGYFHSMTFFCYVMTLSVALWHFIFNCLVLFEQYFYWHHLRTRWFFFSQFHNQLLCFVYFLTLFLPTLLFSFFLSLLFGKNGRFFNVCAFGWNQCQ